MDSWFPLSKSMMEGCAEFARMTPAEKVFWLSVLSEVNSRGEFYKADLEWAVMLALSVSKVRQARRKFRACGWLEIIPGRYLGGQKLATIYQRAQWAMPEKGTFFAPLCRYSWGELLRLVRRGRLKHRDLVVYAFLRYFLQKLGGDDNGSIFVTKRQIRVTTNLPTVRDSFERLQLQSLPYCDDSAGLIGFVETCHRFHITKWARYADALQSGNAAAHHEEIQCTLRRAIARARELQRPIEKVRLRKARSGSNRIKRWREKKRKQRHASNSRARKRRSEMDPNVEALESSLERNE